MTSQPITEWPFVETPGEFSARLRQAIIETPDMLAAVRNVLIENPPTFRAALTPKPDTVAEPVAWRMRHREHKAWIVCQEKPALANLDQFEVKALYAHPPTPPAEPDTKTVESGRWQRLRDILGLDGWYGGKYHGMPSPEQIITHIEFVAAERARLLAASPPEPQSSTKTAIEMLSEAVTKETLASLEPQSTRERVLVEALDLSKAIRVAKGFVVTALAASCDCNTKSPDIHMHVPTCKMVSLVNALEQLDYAEEFLASTGDQ